MTPTSQREKLLPAARLVDGLVAVAGVILGLAEYGPVPFLTPIFSVIAIFFVDGRQPRGIPTALAAALGFVAFGIAAGEFIGGDVEARILAGSHLLTYLTVVVLLQGKKLGDLYRLVTLATLQVALASLLTNSIWLAVGLIVFIATAFLSMSSLLWMRLSVDAGRDADFVDLDTGSRAIRRLTLPSLRLMLISAIVSGVSFVFVPRVWSGNNSMFNNTLSPSDTAETGFSDKVSLGDIVQVMESDEIACEIRSVDVTTGEVTRFDEEAIRLGLSDPLLRGGVMDTYRDGTWDRTRGTLLGGSIFRQFGLRGSDPNVLIRHTVELQPLGTRILLSPGWLADFQVRSQDETGKTPRIDFDAESQVFWRQEDADVSDIFEYDFFTRSNWSYGPNPRSFIDYAKSFRAQQLLTRLQTIEGAEGVILRQNLKAFLQREIPNLDETASALNIAEKVLFLLRDSGKFGYTLDLKPTDRELDPVLDFLVNRRQGHCEYFASSMALLLRSVGVPTRVVNGFKGGDFDAEEGVFRIRQLHAHAWLEVYDFESRGWYTYDPTPGAREVAVSEREESVRSRGTVMDAMQTVWGQGMFMTRQQQQRLIYGPLSDAASEGWALVTFAADANTDGAGGRNRTSVGAAALVIVFLAGGLGVLAFAVIRSRRGKKRASESKKFARRERADAVIKTPWYDRYTDVVKRAIGLSRPDSSTQQEFSTLLQSETTKPRTAGSPETGSNVEADVREMAPALTTAFYESRFGHRPPESADLEEWNRKLTSIENALDG